MADQRMSVATIITDPSTSTRQAAVNASNQLSVSVDNSLSIASISTSITPGTGATNLGKAEDGASADGDVGVGMLAVRKATPANTSGTDGDYEFLQMSAGRLWTSATIDAALPAGANAIGKLAANSGVIIGDVNVVSAIPGTGATNLGKAEDAAHTSGDTGVMVLAVRQDTPGTPLAGTDGDYIPLMTDNQGYLRVKDPNAGAGSPSGPTISGPTASSALAAGSSADIDSADLGGTTKKLTQVDISGSAPFSAIIQTAINGAVVDTYAHVYSPSTGGTVTWKPPHKDYCSKTFSANAGFDGWRVTVKNLDSADAADFYVATFYET